MGQRTRTRHMDRYKRGHFNTPHSSGTPHGVQFTSWACNNKPRSAGLTASFGSVDDGLDNAITKGFWSSVRLELLARRRWKTRVELANAFLNYTMIFSNRRRCHSALAYHPPIEFELLSHHPGQTTHHPKRKPSPRAGQDATSSEAVPLRDGQYYHSSISCRVRLTIFGHPIYRINLAKPGGQAKTSVPILGSGSRRNSPFLSGRASSYP